MKKIVGFISEHKKLLIVLAVLAVAVVVWQVYAGRAQAAAAQAMQANVQTLTLQRGDLARTLSANGSVQSGNAAQAATKLTYPVSEVLVKVGDTVAEGDVVARLDTTDLDEQIKNLQAALSAEKQQSDLAVAQAQHAVKELAEILENNGAEVAFAIHPVAGRMPGHMNVLLAEADVPYEQLKEMEEANKILENADVAIVIGANDVVNPAAAEDKGSPIYGMPIIEAFKAKTVLALKRGKGAGFSGLENGLFFRPNTRMIYGDAKATINELVSKFKDA